MLEEHRDEYLDSDFLDAEGDTELWRISARVGALNDVDYGEFKNDIRDRVEPVLKKWREKLAAKAADQSRQAAKPGSEDAAEPHDRRPGRCSRARQPSHRAGDPIPKATDMGIEAVYTGLVPVVYKAQREMLNGLAWNFVTDLATIAGVMTLVFWDLSAGLILLIPSVFPMLVVFGMMGWLGVVIDVGTIMTPTVALGVSVDDVVHFLIWYRRGLVRRQDPQRGAIMLAYEGCAGPCIKAGPCWGWGWPCSRLSSFVPTQRFGALMFTLLTAALIGNLLLLPAVLASPTSLFLWPSHHA